MKIPTHFVFLDRGGHGAFLVLRLVDLLRPDRAPLDEQAFAYQRTAVERFVTEGEPTEDGDWLGLVLEAVKEALADPLRDALVETLGGYAINRRDAERYDEAVDVLETARGLDPREGMLATPLGECLLLAGRTEELLELAGAWVLDESVYVRRAGRYFEGEVLLARGDAWGAEGHFRALIEADEGVVDDSPAVQVRGALARALLAQGRAAEAAVEAWRAHGMWEREGLGELGLALEALGELEGAANAWGVEALGHPQPAGRWDAVAAEVRITARLGDRVSFERWVRTGRSFHESGLPGRGHEAGFWVEAAWGFASFGERKRAEEALAVAREVAGEAVGTEARFRVREAQARMKPGVVRDFPPPARLPPELAGAVGEAIAGVARYAPAAQWRPT